MNDITKNLLTHGAAVGGGYWLGRKNGSNRIVHHNLFTRFIPTVVVAAGIGYLAYKLPGSVENMFLTSSNNNTKIDLQENTNDYNLKDKALDKGFDIYHTQTKEYNALKNEYNSLRLKAEAEKRSLMNEKNVLHDMTERQDEKLRNIESRLDSVISLSDESIDKYARKKYERRLLNDNRRRKTTVYRDIYLDPYGMRPPVVVERRVKRYYR